MSDEAEKLREQLAARTAYANGLLSSWQAADIENRNSWRSASASGIESRSSIRSCPGRREGLLTASVIITS